MTIIAATIVHPNPGVARDEVQKQLKRAAELARKHGAENVTALVSMVEDPGTNTIGFLTTAQDWTSYDQIQRSLSKDPDYAGLLVDAGHIATWENYVSQDLREYLEKVEWETDLAC